MSSMITMKDNLYDVCEGFFMLAYVDSPSRGREIILTFSIEEKIQLTRR